VISSPLRASEAGPGPTTAGSRRRALGRANADEPTYISPTDTPVIGPRVPSEDALEYIDSASEEGDSVYDSASSRSAPSPTQEANPPTPNLLDISMHSLRLNGFAGYFNGRDRDRDQDEYSDGDQEEQDGDGESPASGDSDETARPGGPRPSDYPADSPPPPGYAPLDPHMYAAGLPADLPEDMVNQAIAAMSGEPLHPQVPSEHEQASVTSRRSSGPLGWLGIGRG